MFHSYWAAQSTTYTYGLTNHTLQIYHYTLFLHVRVSVTIGIVRSGEWRADLSGELS